MEFKKGDMVCLKSDPSLRGIITEISQGQPIRYQLFIGNSQKYYYADQLLSVQNENKQSILSMVSFKARLSALQLLHPGTSSLYSLHAARVNFIPYQFRPVLKLIKSDRPRLLIADEVGVGKTIEAGLILRELQARGELKRVLILCPKALVTDAKWQRELKRFDENFTHLNGPTLRYCINEMDMDGEWPDQYSKIIIPFSILDDQVLNGVKDKSNSGGNRSRRPKGLIDLDPSPSFDLVIVDEAHHLRNAETQVHQVVQFFCENAEAVVFLTATPIQLGQRDLYVLLNMLRPDYIIDQTSFDFIAEPNPAINKAVRTARTGQAGWEKQAQEALIEAGNTQGGQAILALNPSYQALLQTLDKTVPFTPQERINFIRQTEELHTFSNLINRTRRRDIGRFTTRAPETVSISFTDEQQELHSALLETQARILLQHHDPASIKFLMTTIRRQAASCIHGLVPLLEEILNRRTLLDIEEDFELEELELADFLNTTMQGNIRQAINYVLELALKLSPYDPKLEKFLDLVSQKQAFPNNKILVFSAFRHTLRYLENHLFLNNVRVGLLHGETPDEERQTLRNRFSLPKEDPQAIDILFSSEIGCEGLDYQFCDCLINYDIPWNPMRVEQRIGRIDRYGQTSEKIIIYNFVTPGTVDFDIYERCLMRIRVFNEAIGGSEEILGIIAQKIQAIAEDLQLTEEERQEKLQQLADNEIRLEQEQTVLEEHQAELFGITLPPEQILSDIEQFESNWLTPQALQNLIEKYLEILNGGKSVLQGGENRTIKNLKTNQDLRSKLLKAYQELKKPTNSPMYREWEQWLKGVDPNLSLTFDPKTAAEDRKLIFINPVHPLALQAADYMVNQIQPQGLNQHFYTLLRLNKDILTELDLPIMPGNYPFAIYQWQKEGIRTDVLFQPVCHDQILTEQLPLLLTRVIDNNNSTITLPPQSIFDALDEQHYLLWQTANQLHLEEITRMAAYKQKSLELSYQARLGVLQEKLRSSKEERIRRMRSSQIARVQLDLERRKAELSLAEQKATIDSQPIAFGLLIIE